MWFIKFILIILAIYIIGYLFFKFAIPWLFKRFMKKLAKRMNPDYDAEEKQQKKKNDGSINIDFVPKQQKDNKDSDKQDREYVDYEEL